MTRSAEALLDSNVLVAGVTEAHVHHPPSAALLLAGQDGRFAVAAHTYAEAFNHLTRASGPGPIALTPAEAMGALDSIASFTTLVGLTPAQTLEAVRAYAASGGIGARLYDRLVGEAAVAHGLRRIVTWNTGHMRGLFPGLDVVTPAEVA